jgi:chemotaxis response regulator CheB
VVLIGGNTGAPKIVSEVIRTLAADDPPVVIAVSTLGLLLKDFVERELKERKSKIDIKVCSADTLIQTGAVYIIPAGMQGRIAAVAGTLWLRVASEGPVNGQSPSADILMTSAASVCGAAAVGILLSGFGADGLQGALDINERGGYVIAQNPDSAEFPHTAQSAITAGTVSQVVESSEIAKVLQDLRNTSVLG